MKIQQFIKNNLYNSDNKTRQCSGVFTDGNGNFWSYGYHYPLIKRIDGNFYINDQGYSISTKRYICWAKGICPSGSKFLYNNAHSKDGSVKSAIVEEIKDLEKRLKELSKRAFRQKADAEYRIEQLLESLHWVDSGKNTQPGSNNAIKAVCAFGDLICDNQKEKNDWKARMLKAGMGEGLSMPEDWGRLPEDEKERRLEGVLKCL